MTEAGGAVPREALVVSSVPWDCPRGSECAGKRSPVSPELASFVAGCAAVRVAGLPLWGGAVAWAQQGSETPASFVAEV